MKIPIGFILSIIINCPSLCAQNVTPADTANTNAQLSLVQTLPVTTPKPDVKKRYPKQNIKINVMALTVNSYSFGLERSLTRKISFTAGYRYMPATTLATTVLGKRAMQLITK